MTAAVRSSNPEFPNSFKSESNATQFTNNTGRCEPVYIVTRITYLQFQLSLTHFHVQFSTPIFLSRNETWNVAIISATLRLLWQFNTYIESSVNFTATALRLQE
jgi:hypothetical protein